MVFLRFCNRKLQHADSEGYIFPLVRPIRFRGMLVFAGLHRQADAHLVWASQIRLNRFRGMLILSDLRIDIWLVFRTEPVALIGGTLNNVRAY